MNDKAVATVSFRDYGETFHFINPFNDLEVGDKVVYDTSHGLCVGKVEGFLPSSKRSTRLVVQKIDTEAHERRKAMHARKKEILRMLEERRKALEEIRIYRLLAEQDNEMKTLLKELESLDY